MRGVSGDEPEGGAGEWRPALRREPQRREVRTPTARPDGVAWAVAAAPVSHCRRRKRGSRPKTATVERREGSRSPRDRVVARRRRDRTKECACRRSIHPSSGGRNYAVATAAGAKASWARRRTRKRRHMRRDGETRAQQRAAGTKNTALFHIVNMTTANGSPCARRDVARVVRAPLPWRGGCKPLAAAGAWFFARRSVR